MPIQIDLTSTGMILLAANLVVWSLHLYLRRQINHAVRARAAAKPLPRTLR